MLYEYDGIDVVYSVRNVGTETATGVTVSFHIKDMIASANDIDSPNVSDIQTDDSKKEHSFTWAFGTIPEGGTSGNFPFSTSIHTGYTVPRPDKIGVITATASSNQPEPDALSGNNELKVYSYAQGGGGASLHMSNDKLALFLSVDDLRPAAEGDVNFDLSANSPFSAITGGTTRIGGIEVKVELSEGLGFKSSWTPPSEFVTSGRTATWKPADAIINMPEEIEIEAQLTSDSLASIPLEERCITAWVVNSIPPPSPDYAFGSLKQCLGDVPTVLINSGEIDLLTVHYCEKVGGEILYPCRDNDEDDAIDNTLELVAYLESPLSRPYRIGRFGAGTHTETERMARPEGTVVQIRDPQARRVSSGNIVWNSGSQSTGDNAVGTFPGVILDLNLPYDDLTSKNYTFSISDMTTDGKPGSMKAVGAAFSSITALDPDTTQPTLDIPDPGGGSIPLWYEFGALGTYNMKITIGHSEGTPSGTYTFHLGPVAELGVEDAGAQSALATTQRAFTIVAVNNGPDDAPAARVTVTDLNAGDYVSHTATKGTFATSTGVWDIGEMRQPGYQQGVYGRDGEVLTIITSAAVDTEITAAITNTLDYQVCIDSSGNDVDLTSPSETACTNASSTNTWHTTDYYDYHPGNSTTTVKAKDGTGADLPSLRGAEEDTASIVVTWEAVTEVNGRGVTHYEVQRQTNPWETVAENVVGTSYVDTDVNAGDTFRYRVRAVNDRDHKGPWSMPMEGTVPEPEVVTNTETVFRDRVVTVTETVEVPVSAAEAPFARFASAETSRRVAENSAPGTPVGAPVAVERNSGNSIAYSLEGADAALFEIERDSGQILVGHGTVLDYESDRVRYVVEVVAEPRLSSTVRTTVHIRLVDVAESATVSISPAGQPKVGQALTATLTHGGGEPADPRWQWHRSAGDGLWASIQGATSTAYTPTERDAGRRLRAIVTYGEPDGSGDGVAGAITPALPGEPHMGSAALYDANGDGRIDLDEVIAAIRDYYAGNLDFAGVMELIGVYYAG